MSPVYLLLALGVVNAVVSFTILRSDVLSAHQKAFQLGVVWFLPLVGAVVYWAFSSSQSSSSSASKSFLPLHSPSDGAGSDGHGLGDTHNGDDGSH